MAYSLVWHERALDDLRALDRETSVKLIERIKDHLTEQPERLGKPLKGVLKGLYRYRYGDLRVVYALDRAEEKISILYIARRDVAYRVREDGEPYDPD